MANVDASGRSGPLDLMAMAVWCIRVRVFLVLTLPD